MSEISFRKTFPTPFIIQLLEMKFKTGLSAGSGHPSQAMPWIREKAHSVDEKLSFFLFLPPK